MAKRKKNVAANDAAKSEPPQVDFARVDKHTEERAQHWFSRETLQAMFYDTVDNTGLIAEYRDFGRPEWILMEQQILDGDAEAQSSPFDVSRCNCWREYTRCKWR